MIATDPLGAVLDRTLDNYVVSHGRSQYSGPGGVSACGLAAMNCARVVLGKEKRGTRGRALLEHMAKEETLDDILEPCFSWSSPSHLDVDDIAGAPVFSHLLECLETIHGESHPTNFSRLLQSLKDASTTRGRSSCAIITRPPEIIACFYILRPAASSSGIFVIFDSHPRPDLHSHGASFVMNSSLDETVAYLSTLLQYDSSLLADRQVQWQAQLLGHFSGHIFVASDWDQDAEAWEHTALQASLEVLAMRAELAESKAANDRLRAENARLRASLTSRQWSDDTSMSLRAVWAGEGVQLGPDQEMVQRKKRDSIISSLFQQGSSALASARSYVFTPGQSRASGLPPLQSGSGQSQAPPLRRQRSSVGNPPPPGDANHANQKGKSPLFADDGDPDPLADFEFALQQQRLYDEEHNNLIQQQSTLSSSPVDTFECNICLDKQSQEDVAQVDGCGHLFCRDCLRGYVSSQLGSRVYPIVCPVCSAEKVTKGASLLSNALVQQLGLSEEEFAIFIELELAPFSIMVHCRSCKNSFFAEKTDMDEMNIITCPLPACGSSWCKACNHIVALDSPHSCDGTAELRALMGQKGWKYCPGCQTPAEKIDGCNHVKCTSPGCNTHFCYLCSATIVKSIAAREIELAVARHYSSCQMFPGIPPDDD